MSSDVQFPWTQYDAYREVTAYPTVYEKERFSPVTLLDAATKADVLFRGWPFIFVDSRQERTQVFNDRIATQIDLSQIRGHEYFERWELYQSGAFFHRALMEEETYPDAKRRGKIIDVTLTIYHVAEAIGSLWRLYDALHLPDEENIQIQFRYTGMAGRTMDILDPRRTPLFANQACAEPTVERSRRLPLGEWRASDARLAAEISVELFQRFGWLHANEEETHRIAHEFLARPRFGSGYP